MKVMMRKRIIIIAAGIVLYSISWSASWAGEIILYEHSDFNGRSIIISSNISNLHRIGWGDRVSSFRILSGMWTLYVDVNYMHPMVTLGPGDYNWIGAVGFPNDALSSLSTVSQITE